MFEHFESGQIFKFLEGNFISASNVRFYVLHAHVGQIPILVAALTTLQYFMNLVFVFALMLRISPQFLEREALES